MMASAASRLMAMISAMATGRGGRISAVAANAGR
jgi:hypothetical protein